MTGAGTTVVELSVVTGAGTTGTTVVSPLVEAVAGTTEGADTAGTKQSSNPASSSTTVSATGGEKTGATGAGAEGTDLVVRRLTDGKEKIFKLVSDYAFDKKGTMLVMKTTKAAKDSNSMAFVFIYNLSTEKIDAIMRSRNDAKNFSFDEEGTQPAFVVERVRVKKSRQKF